MLGQGSGAVAVHAHLLSPQTRGLFSQVIMESGDLHFRHSFCSRLPSPLHQLDPHLGAPHLHKHRPGSAPWLWRRPRGRSGPAPVPAGVTLSCHCFWPALPQALPAELVTLAAGSSPWQPALDGSYLSQEPLVTMIEGSFPRCCSFHNSYSYSPDYPCSPARAETGAAHSSPPSWSS